MGSHINYSGLLIAGIGFFLTRFTVTLAIYEDPFRFYLAGILPLVLGLGLAAFGVALAVGDVETTLVRTTALWCVIGAGTMLVLVLLTLLGSTPGGLPDLATVRSRTYLSNFLIGGSVGGTLTGLYAATNRRQRVELQQQANRLEVLNRLLRHEVLNAVTVIRGHTARGADGGESNGVIADYTDAIVETINEVKHLSKGPWTGDPTNPTIRIRECLDPSLRTIRERYPEASINVTDTTDDPIVRANERLEQALTHLLENAVVHSGESGAPVEVSVTSAGGDVRVSVSDTGPGLPEDQVDLLENGEIPKYDDPATGFGLNIVRLLVERYRGSIETDVTENGSTISITLPRARADGSNHRPIPADLAGVRPAIPHLVVTMAAAIVAGVVYGIVVELFGGSVGVIGVLYGVENVVVGWITHEFHSVVFGFVFAGLVSVAPEPYRNRLVGYLTIGAGWAIVLWFGAAGIISPIWLRLLGIPAPIPSLSPMLLLSHLAWGLSLAILTAIGYRYVTPRLGDVLQ